MTSFTPQPIYSRNGRISESDGRSDSSSEEKDLLLLPAVQPAVSSLATAASANILSCKITKLQLLAQFTFNIRYNSSESNAR
jgi:hypothetical protein